MAAYMKFVYLDILVLESDFMQPKQSYNLPSDISI